jgi:dephospho-CoA kinase
MQVIGLLGGVASGKSVVAHQLVAKGAIAIDADRLGHRVLKEPDVIAQLHARWGDEILSADGQIDRSQVAKIVFAPTPQGKAELAYLEQITHPRIRVGIEKQIAQLNEQHPSGVLVLDAPVLLKASWDKLCDWLVFVEANEAIRAARAAERGWDADELSRREAAQESLFEKRSHANWVIHNSGSLAETIAQVDQLWQAIQAKPG